jgi:hypothetical protein
VFIKKTKRKLLQQALTKVSKYRIKHNGKYGVTSYSAMFGQQLRRTLVPLIRYWAKGNGAKKKS